MVGASLALFLSACGGAPASPAEGAADLGYVAPPPWLPAYSPAQLALLTPGTTPVVVPAQRVFPDPDQFRHARERTLEDPRDAMRLTRVVAEIVDRSPRMYTLGTAGPELSNHVAQYGPSARGAPDPFLIAEHVEGGALTLIRPPVSPRAQELYDEGTRALASGKAALALAPLEAAVTACPRVPALRLALGRAQEAGGDVELAESTYLGIVRLDPTLATAHERLAAIFAARGDGEAARRSVAHALAYHPAADGALALAAKLALEKTPRVPPFEIFLDVDRAGAVRVATDRTAAARMYAGCRAVMRYEPELRGVIFDALPSEPYFLSAAEEMLCIESAIGAHLAARIVAREEGRSPPNDPQAHGLMSLAHTEGLLGYVMFEILGQHRPEHARTAPLLVHRATVAYVKRHVLGISVDPEGGAFLADARR